MIINSNPSSLRAQRHLQSSTLTLSERFERLSSGLRVNRAADDAAGLSIGTRMDAQLRGASQTIQSNQQSISLMQTAEGALSEQGALLQRMRELCVQSMNATLQSADRASLQEEVDALKRQFDLIGEAEFNGQRLFNNNLTLYSDDPVSGEGSGEGSVALRSRSQASDRVARQSIHESAAGVSDLALSDGDIVITNDQGESFSVRATTDADDDLSTSHKSSSAIAKAKVINEHSDETGVEALVGVTRLVGGFAVRATTLDPSSSLIINGEAISGFDVVESDANGELLRAINASSQRTGVVGSIDAAGQLVLTAQDGRNIEVEATGSASQLGFGAQATVGAGITLRATRAFEWSYSDFSVDERCGYLFSTLIPLNPGTASSANSIASGWQFISTAAGAAYVAPEWSGHLNNNIILTGSYSGFNAAGGHRFHVEVDTLGGGVFLAKLDPEDANGESQANYIGSIAFDPSGEGTYFFASAGTTVPPGVTGASLGLPGAPGENIFQFTFTGASLVDSVDNDGDGVDAFQFTAPVGELSQTHFVVGVGYDETVDTINISSVEEATRALFTIDLALEETSSRRSALGAMMSRFESATRGLSARVSSLSAARARIMDADFAAESAELGRAQITQQAGVAVLAQANSQPQLALALLS